MAMFTHNLQDSLEMAETYGIKVTVHPALAERHDTMVDEFDLADLIGEENVLVSLEQGSTRIDFFYEGECHLQVYRQDDSGRMLDPTDDTYSGWYNKVPPKEYADILRELSYPEAEKLFLKDGTMAIVGCQNYPDLKAMIYSGDTAVTLYKLEENVPNVYRMMRWAKLNLYVTWRHR